MVLISHAPQEKRRKDCGLRCSAARKQLSLFKERTGSTASESNGRSRPGTRVRLRLPASCENRVRGARLEGLAQKGESVVQLRNRHPGIRCHVEQMRRQRVQTNLPSGAPRNAREISTKEAAGRGKFPSRNQDESPRGDAWPSQAGGSHRQTPSTPEGWFPLRGEREVTSTLSAPLFSCPWPPLTGRSQKCPWDA